MKRKVLYDIITQVIIALLIQAVLGTVGFFIQNFNKEKLKITVSSSTECENGYYTCINIKNFQNDKSIESVTMWSESHFDSNINFDESEVYDGKVIFKMIAPSYSGSVIIYSQEKITEDNTRFECNDKCKVLFLSNEKEEVSKYWKQFATDVIAYALIYSIIFIFFYIHDEKEREKIRQYANTLDQKCVSIEKKLEKRENENKEQRHAFLKVKVYFHNKLQDYAKELNFYRNTIQKLIGNSEYKGNISEDITKELKTYRTQEKIKPEKIEMDMLGIDKNKDEKIKDLLD